MSHDLSGPGISYCERCHEARSTVSLHLPGTMTLHRCRVCGLVLYRTYPDERANFFVVTEEIIDLFDLQHV